MRLYFKSRLQNGEPMTIVPVEGIEGNPVSTPAFGTPPIITPSDDDPDHPGFMKLTAGGQDTSLTHPKGWSDNDYFVLEQSIENPARMVVEPGETTVVWYVDNVTGLTAQAIADAETAAGRSTTAATINANWIRNQITTDYGKHPARPVIESLLTTAFGSSAVGTSPWLMIKRGTTLASSSTSNKRGESMLHPLLVSSFGTGIEPVIERAIGVTVQNSSNSFPVGNQVFQGVDAHQVRFNNSFAFNFLLSDFAPIDEEITVNGFEKRLSLWAVKASYIIKEAPSDGIKWNASRDRGSGFYGSPKWFYERFGYYDHNGWDDSYHLDGRYLDENGQPAFGMWPTFYSHNKYMSSGSTYCQWLETFSLRSPFSHIQKRGGGEEIACGYALGNAYGTDASGYSYLKLETVEQAKSFGSGRTIQFSGSDITIELDPGNFWKSDTLPGINMDGALPPGFDPVGRTVTSPQGGIGVVVDYIKFGSYSSKVAVVLSDLAFKATIPSGVIGKRDNGFNGLVNKSITLDWFALIHAVDPNNAEDIARKGHVNFNPAYETKNIHYADLTIFNFGNASNDMNADGISEANRASSTLGAWRDEMLNQPLGTHSSEDVANWLNAMRNPGLLTLDYIDFVAGKIGKPSPKRETAGNCVWTPTNRLSGHNADQPRNWTADGINFTWPIDGDNLVLDGGQPHWTRTCRAVNISLAGAVASIYGGLMSSSGVVSGTGDLVLKNGGQFWYRGTNTGVQRFTGNGGRLGVSGTATGLDVRVGDAGFDGAAEVLVLAGGSAGFTRLDLTGKAALKLDGINNGTAAVTIGILNMTKDGTSAPKIAKARSGHFGINPTTGQPYNPALTGNVTVTGTITASGYTSGDIVINGAALNSLTTARATLVGCQMSGGNLVAI